jgi:hypothetical protein
MILLHCVAFYTPRNEAAGEALTKFQRTKKTRSVGEKWPFLIGWERPNQLVQLKKPSKS